MDIDIKSFDKIIHNNRCAFLCGNGFSMNFDTDFGNIYDRLTAANKLVKTKIVYQTNAQNQNFARILETNYQAAFNIMVNANQGQFDSLFESGIQFADTILESEHIVDILKKEGLINELIFKKSQISLVELISEHGHKHGYKSVNIEYWPVLIYLYFAIKEVKQNYYSCPKDNDFISLIEAGNKYPFPIPSVAKKNKSYIVCQNVLMNGFNTYYRILFSTAIFCNGKAVCINDLDKWDSLDINKLKNFLDLFETIYTLNYDNILENLVKKEIIHLHGKYDENTHAYVNYQNFGIECNKKWYDFSDILIGDYFISKGFFNNVATIQKSNDKINKAIPKIHENIDSGLADREINTVIIFGLNINNDQHILRDLMLAFYDQQAENPKFIYCFWDEDDKKSFQYWYDASITFREDVSEYVKSIELLFLGSKDVLKDYFGVMFN